MTQDDQELRRERINELVTQRRYVTALTDAASVLSELLGTPVLVADAISKEAVKAAVGAAVAQKAYTSVWHRAWGIRLRDEMLEVVTRLADALDGEPAALLWGSKPQVGFIVEVSAALQSIAPRLAPDGSVMTCLLVTDDGQTGLELAYLDDAGRYEEYELRSWGRFARTL